MKYSFIFNIHNSDPHRGHRAGRPWDGAGYVERLQKVEDQIGKTGAFITGLEFSVADSNFSKFRSWLFWCFDVQIDITDMT